ncbi:MAG: helix-turn-helix transcriptional regulator [Armatimonadota bacterium]|nr:helix-turn-helix transcriptional regulator [Armatimonadota bacterium]
MPAGTRSLGTLIRRARLEQRITLRHLASRLGVAPAYLSDIEKDRRTPSYRVLAGLAQELGLDLDEVLARAGRLDPKTKEYLTSAASPALVRLLRAIARTRLRDEDLLKLAEAVERQAKR